ncbi:SDR family oxidoreductase [Marininema halotolerans]|uniref:NADP-dependent 3-hydroxy acid dehydrogenase YdfG n=1 Tax=Marininema halotolerans TaxID=1155944 RepID=A0A1I6P701_9BACL|nr:SDR family oxidoreductase [Marininema halotolerans]SFS35973.1 NADP-dependent 3-hydroxy acid dehydrogenase YdfG [Marininema halotolerans]
MGKNVAVITGTSTGLGLSLSEALAKAGWKVYATMRNLDKAQGVQELMDTGLSIELLQLDVQSQSSIDTAIQRILEKEEAIDLFINNAGMGFLRTVEQATEEEYKNIFDINTFGVIRCIKSILPHMRDRQKGRIVAISSVGGLVGQPLNEIYCASKFALEGLYESLATYLTPFFGIEFMIVEPGGIVSEFANTVLSQINESGAFQQDVYEPVLQAYLGSREKQPAGISQTPEEIATIIVNQLAADELPLRMRTSDWSNNFCRFKTEADPTGLAQTHYVQETFLKR